MIEPQCIQYGRVQVTHLYRILHDLVAHSISLAVTHAGLEATPSQPNGEGSRFVVPADKLHHLSVAVFAHGGAAEFPAPHDERVLEHAALLQISEQSPDGLIGFAAAIGEANVQRIFRGSSVVVPAPVIELNKAHTAF